MRWGWGGGQLSVRLSLESPAALMDRPMMGPAQQDQIGQVGRAAAGLGVGVAVVAAGVVEGGVGPVAWRVTRTRVTAPSQASRRHPQEPTAPPSRPPHPPRPDPGGCPAPQHRQLGPDPPAWGSRPALKGPAGQLGQGISPALAAAAGIVGAGRAGQGFQGGQQALAGLGLQQPIQGHHALQGRGRPQAPRR
jgi:hypothetical protein